MATARAMLERRRSSRVEVRIPIRISGQGEQGTLETSAETVAVSRCGALVRVRSCLATGSRLEILHGLSQESREFRVVRVSDTKTRGLFEWGLEILYPAVNFWGVPFPDES
jgi:PilZ domain